MKKEHTRLSLLELLEPYRVVGDKLTWAKKEILFKKAYELKLVTKEVDPEPPKCNENECWIPLRNIDQKIVDWTLIDKADYDNVSEYSWHLFKQGKSKYASGSKDRTLHQFLLGKAPSGYIIDHKNINGLDNTRKNLRFALFSLNSQNNEKRKGTSSIYYGVSRLNNKWRASYSEIILGSFNEESHAAYAYDTFIKTKYNGEGKINNIVKPNGYVEFIKNKSILPKGIIPYYDQFKAQYWDKTKKIYLKLGIFETIEEGSKVYEEYCKKINEQNEKLWLSQNILRNSDGIAVLPISNNKNLFALVDDDLWHHFMKRKWHIDDCGYVRARKTKLHHEVLINNDKSMVIDHIYNKLDNRHASLRINTYGGNNHHRAATNELNLKGVFVYYKKFGASISFKKKQYSLGKYPTKEIAAYCYNCAAEHFYGDMASINNIDKNVLSEWNWDKDALRLIKSS